MKTRYLLLVFAAFEVGYSNAAFVYGTSYDFPDGNPAISGAVQINGVLATPGQVNVNTGFFNPGFDPVATISDIPTLISNFNVIGSADVGNTTLNFNENHPGLFDTGMGQFRANAGDPSVGQRLYLFYGTGAVLAPGGTGYGLVDSGTTINADSFPPVVYTLSPAGGTILIGEAVTATGINAPALGIFNATAPAINIVTNSEPSVPEPSALLLGLLGFVGLLRRRR